MRIKMPGLAQQGIDHFINDDDNENASSPPPSTGFWSNQSGVSYQQLVKVRELISFFFYCFLDINFVSLAFDWLYWVPCGIVPAGDLCFWTNGSILTRSNVRLNVPFSAAYLTWMQSFYL